MWHVWFSCIFSVFIVINGVKRRFSFFKYFFFSEADQLDRSLMVVVRSCYPSINLFKLLLC